MLTDFRDKIPSLALDFRNTDGIVSILDGMYNYKKEQQDYFFRSYTAPLNPYDRDLANFLIGMGFPEPIIGMPIVSLHTLALNSANIMRYRGSKRGIMLFLQSLTLGKVTLNLDGYYPVSTAIFPDDLTTGFLPNDPTEDAWFIYSPDEEALDSQFSATIETYFHNNNAMVQYLYRAIRTILPFFESGSFPSFSILCGSINRVENMPDYFNFDSKDSVTSIIYYELLSVLFDGGYTLDTGCIYESCKTIYSDYKTPAVPTLPTTSCAILFDNQALITDYASIAYRYLVDSLLLNGYDISGIEPCVFDLVSTFEGTVGIEASTNTPDPNALDFIFSQSYTL